MRLRTDGVVRFALLALTLSVLFEFSAAGQEVRPNPRIRLVTSKGPIIVELQPDKAPVTVENFLAYVQDGFYDGTIFHRVIPGFMIQGGGHTPDMKEKKGRDPIQNEANNGLVNQRGTLAMARKPNPHSATSQFFINLESNTSLNFKNASRDGYGYCVFGKVIEGMDVVDAIAATPTTIRAGLRDVPVEPILIEKVEIIEAQPSAPTGTH